MRENSFLELIFALIFIIGVLYYNNTVTKNNQKDIKIMAPVYFSRINMLGLLFLIAVLVEIIRRIFKS